MGAPMRAVQAIATSCTAVFAGGCLVAQTVVVPRWKELDSASFLQYFADYGPAMGRTLFPFEAAALGSLAAVLFWVVRRRHRGRVPWCLSFLCVLGTLVLLPVYFGSANFALISGDVTVDQVPAEIDAWYWWNWMRTGLALTATVFCCWGNALTNTRD